MSEVAVVHYLNQFFAGIGGEEAANLPIQVHEGRWVQGVQSCFDY